MTKTMDLINQMVATLPPLPNPFNRPGKMYTSPNVNPFTGRLIDPIAEAKRIAAKGAK